jgi:hypothetical protein
VRRFRDGHTATRWAADARLAGYGPDRGTRLVVATTDPATLPERSTWYLVPNLPRPGAPRAARSPVAAADLAEVVRLYGLRMWVEQGYKQLKGELGWADFQGRADRASGRHWVLVGCAFSFCWRAWFGAGRPAWPPPPPTSRLPPDPAAAGAEPAATPPAPAGRGKRRGRPRGGPPPGPPRRPIPRPRWPAWPAALRHVRSWLVPWSRLWRIWRAWHSATPPPDLQWLFDLVGDGYALHLYLRL